MERSLQAAEILQAVGQKKDKDRAQWMKAAGLKEIDRITVRKNKIRCIMSVMVPVQAPEGPPDAQEGAETFEEKHVDSKRSRKQNSGSKEEPHRFSPGELVIGIIDDCTASKDTAGACTAVKQLLQTMTQRADFIPLSSVGLVKEEVTVQPTLLAIATEALGALSDYIFPLSLSVPSEDPLSQDELGSGHLAEKAGAAAALSPGPSSSASMDITAAAQEAAADVEVEAPQLTKAGTAVPLKLSIVGERSDRSLLSCFVSQSLLSSGNLHLLTASLLLSLRPQVTQQEVLLVPTWR